MTEAQNVLYPNKSYTRAIENNFQPHVTLFVAFYNNVEFFRKVFTSIENQSFKDFEVIICDDGSNAASVMEMRTLCQNSHLPVLHLWHSDRGFFKNEILNKGILQSRAEYCIFIDADCVLHKNFIEDHWSNKVTGHTLAGRRVNLTPGISNKLTLDRIRSNYLEKNWWWIFITMAWMKDNNSTKGFRITNDKFYKVMNRKNRGLVGSNFSVFKSDLYKVNGFDMSYHKPGIGEDSDIDFRLSGLGVTPIPFCFRGIQYHLYHKLLDRASENEAQFDQVIESKKYITDCGLKQLKG